ncbi:DUF305 domain-containing protein [Candidatus Saccharibacteria bacterium]|nr:MAG: DUF305 domain-containing protein [Candidatus Saccharibacteria bacterium]
MLVVILLLNNKSQNMLNSSTETGQNSQSGSQTGSMYASMTGDQFDKAYLTDMIAHHQGALNMASQARELATKSEIRTLADAILSSQATEVQQMMDWQQEWEYSTTDISNPHAGHMMESSGSMGDDMANMEAKLNGLSGEAYDKEFLKQMILHHQQAVDMSKYADTNAKHQEVKDLAQAVISAQEKEIADMKSWQQKWGF